jgi:hypothetical protein
MSEGGKEAIGADDAVVARQVAASMPNAQRVILPTLRNAILLEARRVVAPPVRDFLHFQADS